MVKASILDGLPDEATEDLVAYCTERDLDKVTTTQQTRYMHLPSSTSSYLGKETPRTNHRDLLQVSYVCTMLYLPKIIWILLFSPVFSPSSPSLVLQISPHHQTMAQ